MPILVFLAAAGLALLTLLFVADAMLDKGPSPIVTTNVGLPERWHPDAVQVLTSPAAPAPDMSSPAVLAAQPKPESDALAKLAPANSGFSRTMNYGQSRPGDRFSIRGQ